MNGYFVETRRREVEMFEVRQGLKDIGTPDPDFIDRYLTPEFEMTKTNSLKRLPGAQQRRFDDDVIIF